MKLTDELEKGEKVRNKIHEYCQAWVDGYYNGGYHANGDWRFSNNRIYFTASHSSPGMSLPHSFDYSFLNLTLEQIKGEGKEKREKQAQMQDAEKDLIESVKNTKEFQELQKFADQNNKKLNLYLSCYNSSYSFIY